MYYFRRVPLISSLTIDKEMKTMSYCVNWSIKSSSVLLKCFYWFSWYVKYIDRMSIPFASVYSFKYSIEIKLFHFKLRGLSPQTKEFISNQCGPLKERKDPLMCWLWLTFLFLFIFLFFPGLARHGLFMNISFGHCPSFTFAESWKLQNEL